MGKPAFRQTDVERAMRAVQAVGEPIASVEIRPDGTIRVLTAANAEPQALSPLEAWEREHGHGSA